VQAVRAPSTALNISQENFLRKTLFYACNKREPVVHCFTYETVQFGKDAAATD
jgi:hypothetical protein